MATYAIGDVQGCYDELCDLLERLKFDPARDRLLFCGDLVNRGPESLRTLRLLRDLDPVSVVVLGNHDLHLLALAGGACSVDPGCLLEVLKAADREPLLDWLIRRPLAHYEAASGFLLVHAGLAPQWDRADTLALAAEVEAVLRGPEAVQLLRDMYGNEPACWDPGLRGAARLRCIINYLTRVRYCTEEGCLDFSCKGSPGTQRAGLLPWFEVAGRRSLDTPLLFGHWASLGVPPEAAGAAYHVFPLDSGCVWGGRLSALRLEDRRLFSVPARAR